MSWTKCGVFRDEFAYLQVGGLNQWLAVSRTMGGPGGEAAEVSHTALGALSAGIPMQSHKNL